MGSILRNILQTTRNPTHFLSFVPCIPGIPSSGMMSLVQRISGSNPMGVRTICTTSALFAEPMKKKKKTDPAIIKAREERKRKKLEKQIRRLEKHQRQLKPLDELEIPVCILDEPKARARRLPQLPTEVIDARWKLVKEWGLYKSEQVAKEVKFFASMKKSQEKALNELRIVSPRLYEAALLIDRDLIPHTAQGPTETPPIENYQCPDGDYIDVSRKWD